MSQAVTKGVKATWLLHFNSLFKRRGRRSEYKHFMLVTHQACPHCLGIKML